MARHGTTLGVVCGIYGATVLNLSRVILLLDIPADCPFSSATDETTE